MGNRFLEVLNKSGMNLKQFGEYFKIPYRTCQNWKAGQRTCPDYLLDLMEYKLDHVNQEEKR